MAVPRVRREPGSEAAPRSVTILGVTGSIGASTVEILRQNRGAFRVEAVTAHSNAIPLARLACELGAKFTAVADESAYPALKEALAGTGIEAAAGSAAVVEAAQRPADFVMAAISGAGGLEPTLAALRGGRTVGLANKECLVCAGALFLRVARAAGATVLPVDSEHNAVFQALGAGRREDVRRVVLTASGGPFRTWSAEAIRVATPEQALRHPNWSMGRKVTIDSATLMNKGLELIEAHHLFSLAPHEMDVLVHPQSIVHGFVEYRDGSVVAQLGSPDMRTPIAHCLAWPERIEGLAPRLDLAKLVSLTFEEPDLARFPALALARRALEQGGAAPTILNAANEVAVEAFLGHRLAFAGISVLVEETLAAAARSGLMQEPSSLEQALFVDHNARSLARVLLPEIAAKAF